MPSDEKKEALEQQYYPLWLEGNVLSQKVGDLTFGTIPHELAWIAYLKKRVEYDEATESCNLQGNLDSLKREEETLKRMCKRELTKRLNAVRTLNDAPYIDACIGILNSTSDPCEVDAYLERRQGEAPHNKQLQQLTDIVLKFIGETDPSLQ